MVLRRESLEPPMSQWVSIGLLTMSGRTTTSGCLRDATTGLMQCSLTSTGPSAAPPGQVISDLRPLTGGLRSWG
jgi:hypothetical protein